MVAKGVDVSSCPSAAELMDCMADLYELVPTGVEVEVRRDFISLGQSSGVR
jgi:hypothetical protein